jgi:hypothetical protein
LIPDGFISAIFWQQSGGIVCSKRITLKLQEFLDDKMVDQWLINVASGTSVWHPRG